MVVVPMPDRQNEVLMIKLDKIGLFNNIMYRNNIHPWSLQMCQMCQIPDIPIAEFSQQIKPMYVINNNWARSVEVESHHRGTEVAHLEMLANVKHENGLNSILSLSLSVVKISKYYFGDLEHHLSCIQSTHHGCFNGQHFTTGNSK